MATPVDIITMFIDQVLSYNLFVSSVAIGYPMFFFFFYFSEFWERISFGERLAFGFGIGVPLSLFTVTLTNIITSIAGFLRLSVDPTFLWGVIDAMLILFFALIRASIGENLNSEKGYEWFREVIEKRRMSYPYMVFIFLAALGILLPLADPSATQTSINFFWTIAADFVGLIIATTILLIFPLCFLFAGPSLGDSLSLFSHWIAYLLLVSYASKYYVRLTNWSSDFSWTTTKKGFKFSSSKWTKAGVVIGLLLIVIFISIAAGVEPLFSPKLVGVVSVYGSGENDATLYQPIPDLQEYWVLLPVTTTYLFDNPAYPLLNTSIISPDNMTQIGNGACTGGTSNSIPTFTNSDGIIASPLCSPSSRESFQIMPLTSHHSGQAQLVLTYNDNLTFATLSVSALNYIGNFTNLNGSTTDMFNFSIDNQFPYTLEIYNFYFVNLPRGGWSSASSFCFCQGVNYPSDPVTLSTSLSEPVYADFFNISPKTMGNVYLNVTYVS